MTKYPGTLREALMFRRGYGQGAWVAMVILLVLEMARAMTMAPDFHPVYSRAFGFWPILQGNLPPGGVMAHVLGAVMFWGIPQVWGFALGRVRGRVWLFWILGAIGWVGLGVASLIGPSLSVLEERKVIRRIPVEEQRG